MIYLAVILIAFSMFVLYREKGDTRIFLFLFTIGWIVSVFLFIVYIQYLDQKYLYQYLLSKNALITRLIPKFTVDTFSRADTIITVMNSGICVFVYASLCFPLSFIRHLAKNKRLYIFLSVPQILQFIMYSPSFYEYIYMFIFVKPYHDVISFADFYLLEEYVLSTTRVINYTYIVLGLSIMVHNYFTAPKIKYFRSYYFLIGSGYTSIVLLFLTFLWWAPKRLISLTTAEGSMHFSPVSALIEGNIIELYPYLMLVSFATLILASYRFNQLYSSLHSVRTNIFRSFDVTNSGLRFYNHMVKNVAMAVLVDAESLKQKIHDPAVARSYVDRIIRSSNGLLTTLNGIQSKLSVTALNLRVSDIKEVMDAALDQSKREDVSVRCAYDDGPLMVLLDAGHMKEVFVNILNNSIQAMENAPRSLEVEIHRKKRWAEISISDNGRGIEKANLDKIFIPFYSTGNRQENWGLGLSYCYRVVMAHQGRIFVDSEPGNGTSVRILLPLDGE